MGAYTTTLFEVVRADVVDNTKKASAAITAGRGVYISANKTVTQMSTTTTTLVYGIAMDTVAAGQAVPILISGVVQVRADSTTATVVVSGQGAGMTYGTLVYMDTNGKWSSTSSSTQIIGRVVNQLISTSGYELAECYIDVGAYFTPTE